MRHMSFLGRSVSVWISVVGLASLARADSGILLNEILAKNRSHASPTTGSISDWVEIKNTSTAPVDLSAFSLTDDLKVPSRWQFPLGVTLGPGAFLIVELDSARPASTNASASLNAGFSIKHSGDSLYLIANSRPPLQIADQVQFGVQVADLSIGRNATAGVWELGSPTPAAENVPVSLGEVRTLKINEWMAVGSEREDWIELYNPDARPVSLGGLFLSDLSQTPLLSPIHPLSFVGSGEQAFAVLTADGTTDPGHLKFKLGANGEDLKLSLADGTIIDEIAFGRQAVDVSEGRFPDGSSHLTRLPRGGTPERFNTLPIPGIVFSEILSHTDDPLEDAIELQNLRAESVDISGWYLSDNPDRPRKFRVPSGTVMEPGGFAVFYRYQFQRSPGVFPSFGFNSAHGDDLYLYTADAEGNLTGYRIGEEFASAPNGYSFGRYDTSVGPQFDLMERVTLGTDITSKSPPDQTPLFRLGRGASNSLPFIGPLAISELQFRNAGPGEAKDMEFIEVRSLVTTNVAFNDLIFFTNTYTLRGDVDYRWPTNASISAGETVLVVGFDPLRSPEKLDRFRQFYSIPERVQVFGPYEGKLDGNGGTIALYRPDIPQFCFDPDFGFVAPILVDRVRFNDTSPWPSAAGAKGNSLQRLRFDRFGDDPVHWYAGRPTPGLLNGPPSGTLPQLRVRLQQTEPAMGTNVTLQMAGDGDGDDDHGESDADGDELLRFEWRFNGALLESARNSSLELTNVTPRDSGIYSVLASNPYGATHVEFRVSVQAPPMITGSPRSIQLPPGETGILAVTASGTPPFGYEWTKDGRRLVDSTNATLVISNLSEATVGTYSVTVTTPAGRAETVPAVVSLLANQSPRVVVQPRGEDFRSTTPVARGGNFTLRVVAAGEPPLSYQWRRNGAAIPNADSDSLGLENFGEEDVGSYDVEIRNAFGAAVSDTVRFGFLDLPTVEILAPERIVVNEGEDVTFLARATGTPRLYYQWEFNGQDIPAKLCAEHTCFQVKYSDGGRYRVRCWNKRGEVILGVGVSRSVELVVRPRITAIGYSDGDGKIGLTFEAQGGQGYEVQASSDLVHWRSVAEVRTQLGINQVEVVAPDQPGAFFRLVDGAP